MEIYQENQINELSVKKMADGTLILVVIPILETLYSCTGATIRENDDSILISLVRCKINKECPVDVAATPDSESPGSYKIVLPNTDKFIKIDYEYGTKQIWP